MYMCFCMYVCMRSVTNACDCLCRNIKFFCLKMIWKIFVIQSNGSFEIHSMQFFSIFILLLSILDSFLYHFQRVILSSPINHISKLATFPFTWKDFLWKLYYVHGGSLHSVLYFIIFASRSQSFSKQPHSHTYYTYKTFSFYFLLAWLPLHYITF